MAYERRRLSTESDKSSTSTNHSTESNTTYSTLSPYIVHPTIPTDQKLSIITTKKPSSTTITNTIKRTSSMTSPAEQLLARTKNTFVDLNPYFQCSSLPSHWRKNKSLRFIIRTKQAIDVKTNTRVIILAGNENNPCTTLKNNIGWFRGGQAEFNDLRFLGASGRGKKFTLSIIIETNPPQQCTYRRAIKITVDGPRKKREIKTKSDANVIHADDSNIDDESDNETNTSMITESKESINQGSAGLLLLAAAAEQKRRDEQEEPHNRPLQTAPMEITYPSKLSDTTSPISNCLSPSSSLASQFSHSIAFSPTSSSLDDFNSRLSHHQQQHIYLPNTNLIKTTTVPLMTNPSTTNLIFSLTQTQNPFNFFNHQQQRHDPQTIVDTSNNNSSTNPTTNTHVLCR